MCNLTNTNMHTTGRSTHVDLRTESYAPLICSFYEVISGLPRVREKSGKNKIFSRSGNFEKMSGNFGHFTNVREMSGNFVMTINFF